MRPPIPERARKLAELAKKFGWSQGEADTAVKKVLREDGVTPAVAKVQAARAVGEVYRNAP